MGNVKGFPRTVLSTLISQVITKLNTGLSLLNGGVVVGSGNPLPTTTTQLPTTLGVKTSANSTSVTLSSDGAFSTNFGATTDAAASTDTGTASHISLLKRLLSKSSGAPTDRSSTITTGGTAQNAAALLSTRKAYFFQNISNENMWGSFVGTAAPNAVGSFPIFPNGIVRSTQVCETTALSIYGATTGQKFTMWEI